MLAVPVLLVATTARRYAVAALGFCLFDQLDEGCGVGSFEEALTELILPEEAREIAHHAQIFGHHLFRGADEENESNRLAVFGFEVDSSITAADGNQNFRALFG